MNCPNCQTENPASAKFCSNCGTKLAHACPNCGTELPAGARFCFNCGHNLSAGSQPPAAGVSTQPPAAADPSPASSSHPSSLDQFAPPELLAKLENARRDGAMAGERRIVTMLFCDVKGSTAAASRLDPEEWADIMNGAFEYMIRPVYKYEGIIARLMGDAILAFFGAPITHEDDPQRAILAGLEIVAGIKPYREQVRRQWGFDFDVRVGINTGLVVVGAVGSDLRMEYTALGDAINLAARMEQTAMPGTVQIAEPSHKLVAPLFDFEDLGRIEVKGKDEPVQVYRVLHPKAQPGRLRGLIGLESPLVGRDAEMQALRAAIVDLRQGRGQIVSIMGEAGLGKSRLVAELRQEPVLSSGEKAASYWLEGHCLSYQTATPYAPFVELFNRHFELRDDQAGAEKYDRLSDRIAAAGAERVNDVAPFLATMLGIGLSGEALDRVKYLEPPQLRGRIFQAVATYLECLALEHPVVLALDDVHWIDPTSLDLLESLRPLTDRTMLMLLALFRPRRREPSWRFHETAARDYAHRYKVLHLKPLDTAGARQLVANLLHVEDLPEKVRLLILEKAEGNPFFVEEVIRSLLDSGLVASKNGHWRATREIEQISVPDTLAAVITARLDRLDEESRRLAQSASVIGRQFAFATLKAIHASRLPLEEAMTDLERRELVREKTRIPERVYIFKHALTQETAYHSLLLKTRRELHLRVAGVLERTAPEHVNDIALHYLNARQPVRALPFLIEAADRAARAYATQEAIGFYRQALDILPTVDDLALARRAYEGLGNALTFANRAGEAIETFGSMRTLAEKSGDVPMQVSALNKLSNVAALHLGQFGQAETYLNESDRLARQFNDRHGLSEMGLIRCMMCTAVADFDGVVRYMDETVALGQALGVKEQMALGMTHIASSQAFLLQFDKAMVTYEEGLRLCREIGDRMHEAELMSLAGAICYLVKGDVQTARDLAQKGLNIGIRIGDIHSTINGCRMLGILFHQQGEYERAIEYYQRYLDNSRAAGFPWFEAEALCLIGTVYLDISPALLERVLGFHTKALEVLGQPGGMMMGATAWAEIGFCMRAAGKLDEAIGYFQKGLNFPSVTINLERPRLLVGAALVALESGRLDEARKSVAEAKAFAEQHEMKNLYPLVFLAEGRVTEALGQAERALIAFARAEEVALPMNMRPIVWQACARTARALAAAGREEEAKAKHGQAKVMAQEIASLFADEALRERFVENAAAN